MFVRMLHFQAIIEFLLGINPLEKTIALPLVNPSDPLHIDDIRSEADEITTFWQNQIHAPCIRAFISRTASLTPVKSARLMMLCPIFSSCSQGNRRISAILI